MLSSIGITNLIAAGLSFLGCLFVFLKILLAKNITYSLRMALYLAIGDFIFTISNFLTPFSSDNSTICYIEAVVRELSIVFTIYWSVCISFLSYFSMVNPKKYANNAVLHKALILGIIWAIMVSTLPIFQVGGIEYGQDLMFCWIVIEPAGLDLETYQLKIKIMLYAFQIVPFVLSLITIVFCYLKQYLYLKKLQSDVAQLTQLDAGRLLWYPASFLFCILPCVMDDYLRGVIHEPSKVFMYLHIGIFHSVGLINGFVYGALNQNKSAAEDSESELSLSFSDHQSENSALDHLERVGKESPFR